MSMFVVSSQAVCMGLVNRAWPARCITRPELIVCHVIALQVRHKRDHHSEFAPFGRAVAL